jgi:hypothetical protein
MLKNIVLLTLAVLSLTFMIVLMLGAYFAVNSVVLNRWL